jgi:hypothetical protein
MADEFDYVIVVAQRVAYRLRGSVKPTPPRVPVRMGGATAKTHICMPAGVVAMMPGKPLKINNWRSETTPQLA